jgi:hypothetical protein
MSYEQQPQPTPEEDIKYWEIQNILNAREHFIRAQIIAQTLQVGEYNCTHFDSVFANILTRIQRLIQLITQEDLPLPTLKVPAEHVTLDIFKNNIRLGFWYIKKLPRDEGFKQWLGLASTEPKTVIIVDILQRFENSLKYMIYTIEVELPRLHEQRILKEAAEQQELEKLEQQAREGKITAVKYHRIKEIYDKRSARQTDLLAILKRLKDEKKDDYTKKKISDVDAELAELELKSEIHKDNKRQLDLVYKQEQEQREQQGPPKRARIGGSRNKSKRVYRNKRRSYKY